jgi:hypothetical protein
LHVRREDKFVADTGNIVFYENERSAALKAAAPNN